MAGFLLPRASHAIPISSRLAVLALQSWDADSALGQETVTGVEQARDGSLWVASPGGVFRSDGEHFDRIFPGDPAGGKIELVADPGGELFSRTPVGDFHLRGWLDPERVSPSIIDALKSAKAQRLVLPAEATLAIGTVSAAYRDREGAVWVAGSTGIARILPSGIIERRTGPALRGIGEFREDREGSMWLAGEYTGLTVLRVEPFATLGVRDGLSSSHIRAGLVDTTGNLWLATASGIDIVPAQGPPHAATGAPAGVSAFALAQSGPDVYAGTAQGLLDFRNGRFIHSWTSAEGLPDDLVRSVLPDRDGSLWAGTRHGLAHIRGRDIQVYSRMDGLGSDVIGAMLRLRDGTLLVATGSGLQRMSGDHFVAVAGVPPLPVTALSEASDGVWIATEGAGLFHLSGGGTVSPVEAIGLPRTIFAMLPDAHGKLWLRDPAGLLCVDNAALHTHGGNVDALAHRVSLPIQQSMREDGGHPAAWLSWNGMVSFATARGVVSISDEGGQQENLAPLTFLESVSVDGTKLHPGSDELIVPPGRHSLTIGYGSSGFAAPAQVRFRYRLGGAESGWTGAGSSRTASYAGLAPGRYRFEVASAAGNDGAWGQTATLAVRQRPRFYQAWWFYVLLLVAAGAIVYAIYRLRVRYVSTRYDAVLAERTRIAREVHDTLAQGYVALGMQLDIALRLLQNPAHAAAAADQLAEARQLVRENLDDARSSIWNLRRDSAETTLPGRLAAAQESAPAGGPEVRLEVHGTYRPIAPALEQELFRIAQEAVANARRHAGASVVRVALSYGQGLEMTITDNGSGLSAGAPDAVRDGHYGIRGMRERAQKIGASFTMASASGEGVRVCVELRDLDPHAKEAQ